MSILDTFYILFETDAKKAEREQADLRKEAARTADELDKSVKHAKKLPAALNEGQRAAGKLGQSFVGMAGKLAGAVAALVSVGALLSAGRARVGVIDALTKTSERLRIGVSDLDAWGRTVKAAGGEVADADAQLSQYSETLSAINAGTNKRAADTFREIGLAAADSNGDVKDARTGLLELAGALEGMTRQQQLAKIRRLNITDEATVRLLLQGRAAIEAQTQAQIRNGVVTKEQAERVKAYKDSVDAVTDVLRGWVDALLAKVLPALTAGNRALSAAGKWLNENKRFVEGLGVAMAIAAGLIFATFVPAMTAAAITTIAATWPFILLGAAIAAVALAFALAYDDVKAFLTGQPSLIGSLSEKYKWFADLVHAVGVAFRVIGRIAVGTFENMMAAGSALFSGLSSFFQGWYAVAAPIWGLLRDVAVLVFRAIGTAFRAMAGPWLPLIRAVFAGMTSGVQGVGAVFGAVFAGIGRAWDAIFGRIVRGINTAVNGARRLLGLGVSENANAAASGLGVGQRQLAAAGRSPLAAATSSSVSNRTGGSRNVSIGEVNVNTQATDAQGVASGINDALTGQFRSTSAFFDDGVDR